MKTLQLFEFKVQKTELGTVFFLDCFLEQYSAVHCFHCTLKDNFVYKADVTQRKGVLQRG